MRTILFLLLTGLAFGCDRGAGRGGETERAPTPSEAAGGEAAAAAEEPGATREGDDEKPSAIETLGITPPDRPWEEMSFDEREFYMIGQVLPIAKETFREFDPLTFEEFGCESCHGEDGQEREFAMPSPSLPAVPERDTEAWAELERDQPRMVRFMKKKVTPTTATLLGFEVRESASDSGFWCNDCHPEP